jgi:hypothetical protein
MEGRPLKKGWVQPWPASCSVKFQKHWDKKKTQSNTAKRLRIFNCGTSFKKYQDGKKSSPRYQTHPIGTIYSGEQKTNTKKRVKIKRRGAGPARGTWACLQPPALASSSPNFAVIRAADYRWCCLPEYH